VQALAVPRRHAAMGQRFTAGQHHDLTAARELVLQQARPYLKKLPLLAGYEGAGAGVLVPVKIPRVASSTSTRSPGTRCCVPCATRANAAPR
jgi:hypothetical protein